MKLLFWIFAIWITAITAAPIRGGGLLGGLGSLLGHKGGSTEGSKGGGLLSGLFGHKSPSSAEPSTPKAPTDPTKPEPDPAKPPPKASVKQAPASVKGAPVGEPTGNAVKSKTHASESASKTQSASVTKQASTTTHSSSRVSSTSASTSAVNLAAWPRHPVDLGNIPTDAQVKAQRPFDTLALPALGHDYYAGPEVPANVSAPGLTNEQIVNEVASVQKPDNVGGAPLSVPPAELNLKKRAKPGQATGTPAQQFVPKPAKGGGFKTKCPKSFKDVLPFLAKPLQHEAMFYSSVDQFEYQFAEQKHLALVKPSLDPGYLLVNDKCDDFWDHASQAWAAVSSGDVFVLLPDVTISPINAAKDKSSWPLPQWPAVRSGKTSIWEKIEWPQLKANTKVCRVWRVGKNTKPMLLMVRTGPQCAYAGVTP